MKKATAGLTGTNKVDFLTGGEGDDIINGLRGNDVLIGGLGNDTMSGGAGADEFIYRFDGSHDVITDFDFMNGDKLILDSGAGVYSGMMEFGWQTDGSMVSNHLDTANFYFTAGDFNNDGVTDLRITSDFADGSLTFLGLSAVQGYSIFGG